MSTLTQAIREGVTGPIAGDGERFSRTFRFDSSFPGFAGHFPGYPILPAVAQVQTALVLAEDRLGAPLRLQALESAKFLAQVFPGEELDVALRDRSREGRTRYEASIRRSGELVASFLLEVARKEEG